MNKNITITETDQPFVLLVTLHDEGDRKILVHASTDYGREYYAGKMEIWRRRES